LGASLVGIRKLDELLITEQFAPRVRLDKLRADLPLTPEEPRFFGEGGAPPRLHHLRRRVSLAGHLLGHKSVEAWNRSNNSGVLRWPVDGEQCYRYWLANRLDRFNGSRACRFRKAAG
jgi:hypothetical protein